MLCINYSITIISILLECYFSDRTHSTLTDFCYNLIAPLVRTQNISDSVMLACLHCALLNMLSHYAMRDLWCAAQLVLMRDEIELKTYSYIRARYTKFMRSHLQRVCVYTYLSIIATVILGITVMCVDIGIRFQFGNICRRRYNKFNDLRIIDWNGLCLYTRLRNM